MKRPGHEAAQEQQGSQRSESMACLKTCPGFGLQALCPFSDLPHCSAVSSSESRGGSSGGAGLVQPRVTGAEWGGASTGKGPQFIPMTGCPSSYLGLWDFVGKGLGSAKYSNYECVCVPKCASGTFSILAMEHCPMRTAYQRVPTGLCPQRLRNPSRSLKDTGSHRTNSLGNLLAPSEYRSPDVPGLTGMLLELASLPAELYY